MISLTRSRCAGRQGRVTCKIQIPGIREMPEAEVRENEEKETSVKCS